MEGTYEERKPAKNKYTSAAKLALISVVIGIAPFIPAIIIGLIGEITGCGLFASLAVVSIPAAGIGLLIALIMTLYESNEKIK